MQKRRLGESDIYLSILGVGCWAFGGGEYWGEQSQKDVDAVVSRALDLGINFFDTAEVYNDGESERSLGIALKGKRDKAIIGTKFSPANASPASLRQHCNDSLQRLNTDYIDLYMLHWPINSLAVKHFTNNQDLISSPPSLESAFETLRQLQAEGKVRYIGVSNFGVRQMMEIKKMGATIVANELAYNLLSRAILTTFYNNYPIYR